MPNVLIAPSQAKIIFDSLVGGSSTQSTLLSSSQITYNGVGEINIASYVTAGTERLSVDGVNGRLFTVSDVASGSIFSINDISGLPIIDVNTGATDVIKIGTYGTNALVINDTKVGIGTATPSQALQVVGNQTTSGVIYATLGTAATSTTTGAVIVMGGVGISGGFYAGTTSYFAQGALLTFAANTSGKLLNIGGNTYSGSSTTSSIYTSNGNLHIDAAASGSAGQAIYLNYHGGTQGVAFCGGTSAAVAWMGPDGDLWKGSADNTGNQYYHTGNDTGLAHLAGTETLSGAKTFSAVTTISNATSSTATNNGALVVTGGVGIGSDLRIGGGIIIEGSLASGGLDYAGYRNVGNNLTLKGNSTGVSGIFFQSEKDGTNINHGSDYGYIQFHAQGIDGVSGEVAKMVIGVANDSDDLLVLQSPYKNGVKISFKDAVTGTGGTEYTVWHAGNDGSLSTLDADLLDGQHGAYYATDSLAVHLAGTETITGAKTFSAITTISNTTVSSSTSTGALIVNGGLGVAGAVNIGGIASGLTATVNTNTTQLATTAFVLAQAASATPLVNGTAAVGVSTKFAREDHVHPPDPGIASDLLTVHLAGTETITGAKTFSADVKNTSGRTKNVSVKTANYTLLSTDHIIVANSGSALTLTLTAASSNTGREYIIKNKGAGVVTVDATALGQMDGVNTTTVAQYSAMTVVSDGTTWNIL